MKNSLSADISSLGIANGTVFSGGNTSLPFSNNIANFNPGMGTYPSQIAQSTAPFGMGPSIGGSGNQQYTVTSNQADDTDPYEYTTDQFGNYTLEAGTTLFAWPYGGQSNGNAAPGFPGYSGGCGYNGALANAYASNGNDAAVCTKTAATSSGYFGSNSVDPAMAVLGGGWEQLAPGDIVHVSVIYIPTGATIFSKDVAVAGA
jgi:hypothetical protein